MDIAFKSGERARFYAEISGLSEIMAGFIRHLLPDERQQAIAKANDIQVFINASNLTSATIQRCDSNDYGFSTACEILGKPKEEELQVELHDLELLWIKITQNRWSRDHWLALKMALHTRLPGTRRDKEIDAAVDKSAEKSSAAFRSRLAAEDEALEAVLRDRLVSQ